MTTPRKHHLIVRKLFSLQKTLARKTAFNLRKLYYKLSAPDIALGHGVKIARAVKLEATDSGSITLGQSVVIEDGVWIVAGGGQITIGDNVFIGRGTMIVSKGNVTIGNDALIGEYVSIRDQNHNAAQGEITRLNGFDIGEISIAPNVWVGARSVILKGAKIGAGSVIGAGSIVTGGIPADTVAFGVPAKPHRAVTTRGEQASASKGHQQ